MKLAVLNMADTGACDSLAYMLEAAGYRCALPDTHAREGMRAGGLEGIITVDDLVNDWGYDRPSVTAEVSWEEIPKADLFVDLKAHANYGRIVNLWPSLQNKVLWYCINGGDPRQRKDGLPWVSPPCPLVTPNQWHRGYPGAYVFWPRFMRQGEYSRRGNDGPPICLVHNVARWGYGDLLPLAERLGVECYGVNAPKGKITRVQAKAKLERAVCMVHLKAGDSVGYAILEAIAAGCPIVCSQKYIDECRVGELLEPGLTCAAFTDNLEEVVNTVGLIGHELAGIARNRLSQLQWNESSDGPGFAQFLRENF